MLRRKLDRLASKACVYFALEQLLGYDFTREMRKKVLKEIRSNNGFPVYSATRFELPLCILPLGQYVYVQENQTIINWYHGQLSFFEPTLPVVYVVPQSGVTYYHARYSTLAVMCETTADVSDIWTHAKHFGKGYYL